MPTSDDVGLRTALYFLSKLRHLEAQHSSEVERGSNAWHEELKHVPLPPVVDRPGHSWSENFERAIGQIDNAQRWCASQAARLPDAGVVCSLFPFAGAYLLGYRSRPDIAIRWFQDAIAHADHGDSPSFSSRRTLPMPDEDSWEVAAKMEIQALNRKAFYWDGLGMAHYEAGNCETALECFATALAFAGQRRKRIFHRYRQNVPGNHPLGITESKCLNNMGMANTKLGRATDALDCHRRANESATFVGTRHDSARNIANAAMAMADEKKYKEAMRSFETALSEARGKGDRELEGNCLGNIGIIHCELGRPGKAIPLLRQALDIHRERQDLAREYNTLAELGIAFLVQGDFEKGISCIQQHVKFLEGKDDHDLYVLRLTNLGNGYCAKGDLESARQCLERATRVAEQRPVSNKTLLVIESFRHGISASNLAGSPIVFVRVDQGTANISIGLPALIFESANSLKAGGEHGEAIRRFFREKIEETAGAEQFRLAFGMALDWAGKSGEAVSILLAGADQETASPALANQIAWAIVDSGGSEDEAHSWLQIARKGPSLTPYIADTEAWIRFLRGDYVDALDLLTPHLASAASVPEIAFHAAKIYTALGEEEKAARYLKLAVQAGRPFNGSDEARRILSKADSKGRFPALVKSAIIRLFRSGN